LITAGIALPLSIAKGNVQRGIRIAAGVASIAFGLILAHKVGVVDGLFAASPSWTPK
jgi:hypothetical protein